MAYLTCTDLSVGYTAPVAGGISFGVGTGEAVFVFGENGAGNSTLVKTLLGLLPALSGEVAFGDGASKGEVTHDIAAALPHATHVLAMGGGYCSSGVGSPQR